MRSETSLFEHLIWFALFLLLYYTPMILNISGVEEFDERILYLANDLLAANSVRLHIALNFFTHLLLALSAYGFFSAISRNPPFIPAGSRPLKALTLIVGCCAIMAVNQIVFPTSNYAALTYMLGDMKVAAMLLSFIFFLTVWSVYKAANIQNFLIVCFIGISMFLTASFTPFRSEANKDHKIESGNIIIIGVDSLSYDTFHRYRNLLPNLDQLISSSWEFSRAYTPLGRTFPAWTSIFSGLYPADHKAIFNLRSLDQLNPENMLPMQLQSMGYETIFALDERRFNNMDKSFGFDAVVGPRVGALDFLLQDINDTPLTNAILQSGIANWLLPYSRNNSASFANYDAYGFVDQIIQNRQTKNPLFLAAHFETAHFPYKSRHSKLSIQTGRKLVDNHVAAMEVVDRQIGRLISALKDAGELDNALLVVLSDHGEAFGEVEAVVQQGNSTVEIRGSGHGSRVDSLLEYQVIMGLSEFRNGTAITPSREISTVFSLVGIRDILEEYLASGELRISSSDPCVHTETGIWFNSMYNLDNLDVNALVKEAVLSYELTESGLLQIREEFIDELIARKNFGLVCKETLTIFESASGKYSSYSLDKKGKINGSRVPETYLKDRISAYIARERANNNIYSTN